MPLRVFTARAVGLRFAAVFKPVRAVDGFVATFLLALDEEPFFAIGVATFVAAFFFAIRVQRCREQSVATCDSKQDFPHCIAHPTTGGQDPRFSAPRSRHAILWDLQAPAWSVTVQ